MATLLLNRDDFADRKLISSRTEFDALEEHVAIFQDVNVRAVLGSDLYEDLISEIESEAPLSEEYNNLIEQIKPYHIYGVMARYTPFSQETQTASGYMSLDADGYQRASYKNISARSNTYADTSNEYKQRLIDFLYNNSDDYQLYTESADNPIEDEVLHRFIAIKPKQ